MCHVCGNTDHHIPLTRRDFLAAGTVAAFGALTARGAFAADPPKPGTPPPNAIPPAEALKRLVDGNARYVANTPNERDFSATRAARATAQYPFAAILSCADSRVAPELLFDQAPGELFVVRVAGSIVTNSLLASLEYGVQFLGVRMILVLGHSSCGAVDAAIKVVKTNAVLPGHLPELISAIKPAVAAAEKMPGGVTLDNAIVANVRRQVTRLEGAAPIVQKAYKDKTIGLVGGVYDIATGKVTLL